MTIIEAIQLAIDDHKAYARPDQHEDYEFTDALKEALTRAQARTAFETLQTARYKILVAVRPLAGAREAFNLIVAEFMQAEPNQIARDTLESLKLEEK